jgi:transcription termination factor Rho
MSNTRSTSKEKNAHGSDVHQATQVGKSSGDIPPTKMVTDINEEPVSLAEEIVVEIDRQGSPSSDNTGEQKKDDIHIAQLQQMSVGELLEYAEIRNIPDVAGLNKQDLIFRILKEQVKHNGLMYGEGTLEILPDGFGFLRSSDYHYLSCPDDIYVSPSQIRRFSLRTGTTVSGQIRPPKENERYFALLRVEAVNYQDPNLMAEKIDFDELTPLHPEKRIVFPLGFVI